jgi:catechol 2,3-dioxygenase-like lactoylglutathione lyase family enzyme
MLRNPRHVIAVHDLERSAQYYRDVLGFEVREVGDPGWRFFVNDQCFIMGGECQHALSPLKLEFVGQRRAWIGAPLRGRLNLAQGSGGGACPYRLKIDLNGLTSHWSRRNLSAAGDAQALADAPGSSQREVVNHAGIAIRATTRRPHLFRSGPLRWNSIRRTSAGDERRWYGGGASCAGIPVRARDRA